MPQGRAAGGRYQASARSGTRSMARGTNRHRSRKINHKTRILVKTGFDAVGIVDEPLEDGESRYELEDAPNAKLVAGTATSARGVDQVESEEVHLKEVLASRRGGASPALESLATPRIILNQVDGRLIAAPSPPPPVPSASVIPTPSSSGRIDPAVYALLYPSNVYSDPHQLLRFSDTVEESIQGAIEYDMDEQDEDWLISFNCEAEEGRAKAPRKGPAQEARRAITEDEFELVMEGYERAMDELTGSVQSSKSPAIPAYDTLLPGLRRQPAFICRPLPDSARWIYPHWRQRRLARDAEPIIPRLDNDSAGDSPYVCFRRREVKLARKTRRSDEQNVARLVRVRDDRYAALELMKKVDQREKLLLESITLDRKIFDGQVEVREMKRKLGEDVGDEALLIIPERKRKHIVLGASESPGRRPQPSSSGRRGSLPHSTLLPIVSPEERQRRKDNLAVVIKRVEQDEQRKKAETKGWEDSTSGAYHPRRLQAGGDRYWTAFEPREGAPRSRDEQTGEWSIPPVPSRSGIGGGRRGPVYRKRIGRGGRIMLDRAGLGGREGVRVQARDEEREEEDSMTEAERAEEERAWARRLERYRYDDDLAISSLPTRDEPQLIDDFDLPYLLRRSGLLDWGDAEMQHPDPAYLQDAFKYLDDLSAAEELVKPPEVLRPPVQPPPPLPNGRALVPIPAVNRVGMNRSPQRAAEEARRISLQQSQLAIQREMVLKEHAIKQAQSQVQERFSALQSFINNSSSPAIAKAPMFPQTQPQPRKLPLQPTSGQRPRSASTGAHLPQAWQVASSVSQEPSAASAAAPSMGLPTHFAPPPRFPLGANQLPATSKLAAPPYSNLSAFDSPTPPAAQAPQPRSVPFSAFPPPLPSPNAYSIAPRSNGMSADDTPTARNYAASPQESLQSSLAQTPRRGTSVGHPSPSGSTSSKAAVKVEKPAKRRRTTSLGV